MDSSDSRFSSLTDDLIIEILLRLPVKSLIRFRCVCKFWNSLFRSDSDFIKYHLKQSLVNNPAIAKNVTIYFEHEFRKNHALNRINPSPKLGDFFLRQHYVFVGSSNGILCYYSKVLINENPAEFRINVHLWNPATNEFRSLPKGKCQRDFCGQVIVIFVHDSVKDDYKVVKFHCSYAYRPLFGEVYSLSTNTWKTIKVKSLLGELMIQGNIVEHNGVFHCITRRPHHKAMLSVFDIDEMKHDEFSLPYFDFRIKPLPWVGTFKEFVSLSIWRDNCEMWVMKEYGVWTRQFVLENTGVFHTPYGMTSSGKILALNWKGEDVLFDGERKKVENFVRNKVVFIKENTNYSDNDHVVVGEYVESLISVFPPTPPKTTSTSEIASMHTDA